jgi:hypothetical protein
MKRIVAVFGLLLLGTLVFSQVNLPAERQFVSGNWVISEDRLYQNDADASLAKMNIPVLQQDRVVCEFDVRYEGGAEDGHGGFGLHLFTDRSSPQVSWGAGSSYLLWLNYDENSSNKDIPAGLSAQLYRSYSDSRMELVQSFDLNRYAALLTKENLSMSIPFKIVVDARSGEIRVYDPTLDGASYFVLNVKENLPLQGNWVVLRTNGMSLSFTN